jgi:hypothetical protein
MIFSRLSGSLPVCDLNGKRATENNKSGVANQVGLREMICLPVRIATGNNEDINCTGPENGQQRELPVITTNLRQISPHAPACGKNHFEI